MKELDAEFQARGSDTDNADSIHESTQGLVSFMCVTIGAAPLHLKRCHITGCDDMHHGRHHTTMRLQDTIHLILERL